MIVYVPSSDEDDESSDIASGSSKVCRAKREPYLEDVAMYIV